jgi:hypothetical protein
MDSSLRVPLVQNDNGELILKVNNDDHVCTRKINTSRLSFPRRRESRIWLLVIKSKRQKILRLSRAARLRDDNAKLFSKVNNDYHAGKRKSATLIIRAKIPV